MTYTFLLLVAMMGQQGTVHESTDSIIYNGCRDYSDDHYRWIVQTCKVIREHCKLAPVVNVFGKQVDEQLVCNDPPAHPERKPAAKPGGTDFCCSSKGEATTLTTEVAVPPIDPKVLGDWIEKHCRIEEKHTEPTDCNGRMVSDPKQAFCLVEVSARIRCNQ